MSFDRRRAKSTKAAPPKSDRSINTTKHNHPLIRTNEFAIWTCQGTNFKDGCHDSKRRSVKLQTTPAWLQPGIENSSSGAAALAKVHPMTEVRYSCLTCSFTLCTACARAYEIEPKEGDEISSAHIKKRTNSTSPRRTRNPVPLTQDIPVDAPVVIESEPSLSHCESVSSEISSGSPIHGLSKSSSLQSPTSDNPVPKMLLKESKYDGDTDITIGVEPTPTSTSGLQGPCAELIAKLQYETVFKYTYEFSLKRWSQCCLLVKIDSNPFSNGNLRRAYRMLDLTKPEGKNLYVAKSSICKVDPVIYFGDAEAQALAKYYAIEYNKRPVPKLVHFLKAFVVECPQRPDRPLMACERYLEGEYIKYNNNDGYVDDERNTPQAFSHWTYVHSGGKYLVVDMQGVCYKDGDVYTDPQVHSWNGEGFGLGNRGPSGIRRFFETHKCNSICIGLRLTKEIPKAFDRSGTVMVDRRNSEPDLPKLPPTELPSTLISTVQPATVLPSTISTVSNNMPPTILYDR